MPNYYPVMLDLRGRPATVVGGDSVAAEKAAGLAAAGAVVTVQSHAFCDDLEAMAARGEVTLRRKAYAPGDLAGAFIVVAAVTYDQPLVEAVWAETQARGQLTNIVDVPARWRGWPKAIQPAPLGSRPRYWTATTSKRLRKNCWLASGRATERAARPAAANAPGSDRRRGVRHDCPLYRGPDLKRLGRLSQLRETSRMIAREEDSIIA